MNSLSFFSGCLGLDLGLKKAGIEPLLFCESDRFCKETIKKNEPSIPLIDDILSYTPQEIKKIAGLKNKEKIDLIVGGPPCQAFSTAGKRESFKDPRGNVFLYFVKVITDLMPNYFVIENVRGLMSASLKHRPHNQRGKGFPPLSPDEVPGGALKYVLTKLKKSGYEISFNLYNSANYGVPQKRERIIIIGSIGTKVQHLKPTHHENGEYGLKEWVDIREAFKGLGRKKMHHTNFSEKRLKYYKLLKSGQNWRNLPIELQKEAMGKSYYSGGGKTGFYRRLAWDKPSPAVVTHPAMPATDLCHPEKDRPLSVEEYKRIQQIPDNFFLAGTVLQQYKQIGNAVPVGLGEAVGREIINHNNGVKWNEDNFRNFKYSRYRETSELTWGKSNPQKTIF
jgi:DNA (cytosine-5)-methyltransferase 1